MLVRFDAWSYGVSFIWLAMSISSALLLDRLMRLAVARPPHLVVARAAGAAPPPTDLDHE